MSKRPIAPLPGPRTTLRLLSPADLPRTLAWRNQERVRTAFITSSVLSEDGHRRWFDAYVERDDDFVFIIEARDSGRPVGQVVIGSERSMEVGGVEHDEPRFFGARGAPEQEREG